MLNEYVNIDKSRPSIVSSVSTQKVSPHESSADAFERAIDATKFGKFQICLALVSILVAFTISLDTGSTSYATLAAECDLNLSLNDKGVLNAVVYGGMVTSATIWGVFSDVLGRKKTLVVGLLLDFSAIFLTFMTQNFTMLMVANFFKGFMVIGPFATINAYVAEMLTTRHRAKFLLLLGCSNTCGTLLLPIFAWILLPLNLDFNFWGLEFHSWNMFLLITGLPAIISGICLIFFPESPKFYMAKGKNEKALKVLRKIYSINTGKNADTYPIKKLENEAVTNNTSVAPTNEETDKSKTECKKGFYHQIKPLFRMPHLKKLILICTLTLGTTMSLNTLRLWIPQIFKAIAEYENLHGGNSSTLCNMIELIDTSKTVSTVECTAVADTASVYINTIIISATSMLNYLLAIIVIPYFGKKKLVCTALAGSGLAVYSIYFARNPESVLAGACVFQAFGALAANLIVSISVDMFPTSLRTSAISCGVMLGRGGSMGGSFLFPTLLTMGCEPPFFFVGTVFIGCAVLCLFLPKTDQQTLQ